MRRVWNLPWSFHARPVGEMAVAAAVGSDFRLVFCNSGNLTGERPSAAGRFGCGRKHGVCRR